MQGPWELEVSKAGIVFVPLALMVTAISEHEGHDEGCAMRTTGASTGSLDCLAEPGKAFQSPVESSPSGSKEG